MKVYFPCYKFTLFCSTFCMVDTNYECIAVTVYNLANGQGVIIGDIVAIAIPFLRSVDFRFKNMVIFSEVYFGTVLTIDLYIHQ